jgi:hypothetical protein
MKHKLLSSPDELLKLEKKIFEQNLHSNSSQFPFIWKMKFVAIIILLFKQFRPNLVPMVKSFVQGDNIGIKS